MKSYAKPLALWATVAAMAVSGVAIAEEAKTSGRPSTGVSAEPQTNLNQRTADTVSKKGYEAGKQYEKNLDANARVQVETTTETPTGPLGHVANTVDRTTTVTTTAATGVAALATTSINALPKSGQVKISGTVEDVDNNKKFTIADSTGKVKIKTDAAMPELKKGDAVEVIGNIDRGMMGSSIKADSVVKTAVAQ